MRDCLKQIEQQLRKIWKRLESSSQVFRAQQYQQVRNDLAQLPCCNEDIQDWGADLGTKSDF
jgi:hypothetical protein